MSAPEGPHELGAVGTIVYALVHYSGLFLAVGTGWLVWRLGTWLLETSPGLGVVFGLGLAIAGICLGLAGLVGITHKLLVEVRSASIN